MEKVVFAESWQQVFADFGLGTFEDFFNYPYERKINMRKKRDVQLLTLGEGENSKEFFVKRFYNPHFKDMLFTWRNFGGFCSLARYEWENARLLFANGIKTYKPVCYGEQTKAGIERRSFLVTEKLQSQCLTEFVAGNWSQLSQGEKEKLIVSLAKTVRRIHNAKISMPDLYVWHFYVSENNCNGSEYEFAIIDLHRMKTNIDDLNQRIRNLAAFDFSMRAEYFDSSMRRLFLESYASDNWPGGIEQLAKKVKKRSQQLSSRRKQKPY